MVYITCLCLVLSGTICFIQGKIFTISTKFMDGTLIFTWSNISTIRNDIIITKDSQRSPWIQVYDDQYTVDDVMLYKSVTIMVREYDSPDLRVYMVYNKTYNVNSVESKEGESRNISWTAEYFPQTGNYFIFHAYNGSVSRIISIDNVLPPPTEKYVYHTRPFNSTNILFEVRNIAVQDAGYYVGSTSKTNAWSGERGGVLAVYGKPLIPTIAGDLNITVKRYALLKCESKSTSAPYYYKKFPSLSYLWFVNNTKENGQTRETYSFIVSKDIKYNRYSCQAKEALKSKRSEEVRINPLYGPESVIITPQPPNYRLSIHDGAIFGPCNCSADCNPHCTLQWKYKSPSGLFWNATAIGFSSVSLPTQMARRAMTSIRCIVDGAEGRKLSKIKLNIQYLSAPVVYINGKPRSTFTVNERNPLLLSCLVEGNPTPEVTLRKATGNKILGRSVQKWLNYTLIRKAQCSDTSIYHCQGRSTEFVSWVQSFHISVLCDPRLDESLPFKTTYGSMSGPDVKVVVNLPVVANPLTASSGIVWLGPTSQSISTKVSERDTIIYKHWINSTIPVSDQRSFGNYSMKYNGKSIVDITIKAQDKPQPPLNFNGYAYASGYINLTWVANFNGGPEQFFILSHKHGSHWIKVTNLSDPGEGNMGYNDLGPFNPGQEYRYRLESCNIIGCSKRPAEVKVTIQGRACLTTQTSSFVVGVLSALIVFLTPSFLSIR